MAYRRQLLVAVALSVTAAAAAVGESLALSLTLGASAVGAIATAGFLWLRNPISSLGEPTSTRAAWATVHAEVQRTRRHGRSFVILATRGDTRVASLVEPLLRTPDRTWVDNAVVYVLVTDCNGEQALGFLERARLRLPDIFAANRWRMAAFPADAVTVGGMLELLHDPGRSPASAELVHSA